MTPVLQLDVCKTNQRIPPAQIQLQD